MGAVPKHKTSTQRKGKRRSSIKLSIKNTLKCPQCQAAGLPHQACRQCGYHYKAAK